jgi:hypothetical protein
MSSQVTGMAPARPLEAALQEMARRGEVGCEYWLAPLYGLSARWLHTMGVATVITRRVPRCHDHGCAVLERCPHRALFEQRAPGIGSKKCRLNPTGHRIAVLGLAPVLPKLLPAWPLASRVLDRLAGAGRPLSVFELTWQIVAPVVQHALDPGSGSSAGRLEDNAPSRGELKLALDLLATAGLVRWTGDGELVAVRGSGARRPAATGEAY